MPKTTRAHSFLLSRLGGDGIDDVIWVSRISIKERCNAANTRKIIESEVGSQHATPIM